MQTPHPNETTVSQIDAPEDARSVAVESSIKRRSVGPVPLALLVAVLVGGFALWPRGSSESDAPSAADGSVPPTNAPSAANDTGADAATLAPEAVPLPFGLERLFVIMRADAGRVAVTIDADGTITETNLNSERAVEPDAGGQNVAQLDIAGVLRAGPPGALEVVDVAVVDFVWHETDSGRLLYLTRSPGGVSEMVEHSMASSSRRRLVSDESGRPVWFGRSGYAVLNRTSPEMVRIYNNEGVVVRVLPFGVVLGESPEGNVYYTNDDGGSLIVDMATGSAVDPEFAEESLTGARLSPTGSLSAVQVPVQRGSGLFFIGPEGVVHEVPGNEVNASTLGWNADGDVLAFVSRIRSETVDEDGIETRRYAQISLITVAGEPVSTTIDLPVSGTVDHVRIR